MGTLCTVDRIVELGRRPGAGRLCFELELGRAARVLCRRICAQLIFPIGRHKFARNFIWVSCSWRAGELVARYDLLREARYAAARPGADSQRPTA
jgi:hypothetical protein